MASRFRSVYTWLLPAWLTEGEGGKVAHALTLIVDAGVQRLRDSLEARMPRRAGPSALRLIGDDRGIPRGRSETAEHYAERLVRWRYPRGHRCRGSAFALLEQVSEYWGGLPTATVDARGTWHLRSADGVETVDRSLDWTWDARPASDWARFWVLIDARGVLSEWAPWGGEPDSEETIGQVGATVWDVRALRDLLYGPRPWRPAGTLPEWAVVVLEGELVDIDPDATWARWSTVDEFSVRTESRDPNARYWALDPERLLPYAGDATLWTDVPLLDGGGDYEGDDEVWLDAIPLADTGEAEGSGVEYPATIRLVDDGEHY
ncbi:MAG: hypothetical protein WC372_11165 [Candidatus Neomarinimicrobiota bacterium]